METTVTDANTENSSISDSMISSPDYVAPIEGAPAGDQTGKDAAAEAAAAAEQAKTDAAAKEAEDAKKKEDERFDKHPRFVELNTNLKTEREARVAAEAKLELFKKSPIGTMGLPNGVEAGEVKDISKMSAEELREWREDDPIGYDNNLIALTTQRIMASMNNNEVRTKTISEIEKTFSEYGQQNPDFNELWDKGEILKYMKEHPGHNAISAHMALTSSKSVQAKIDAAVAKAVKETEEKVTKNFQAKRNATVINQAAPTRTVETGEVAAELKDTKPHGGFVSVAAQRLADMRRASA